MPVEKFVFSNFAVSTLREAVGPEDTELQLNVDDVERFPDLSGGGKFPLLLIDSDDNVEVTYVSLLGSDGIATVERGREGTVAQSWLAGTYARHTITAASLAAMSGLNAKGTWSSGQIYNPLDVVVHGSISYMAVNESVGSTPSLANPDWMVLYQPPGAASTAMTWQGRWASSTTYAEGHVVERSGRLWRSNIANNLNSAPVEGNANWSHVARGSLHTNFAPVITCTGTNNYASTISPDQAPSALYDGMELKARFANSNTGPSTLALTVFGGVTLAAVALRRIPGQNLPSGYIRANELYTLVYDAGNTSFIFVSESGSAARNDAQDMLDADHETRLDALEVTVNVTNEARLDAHDASLTSLGNRATALELAIIPVGTVVDFAGTVAPTRWHLCYGQALNRTTYAALFTAIGTTYGVGDGSTTFNLPDARGRVTAGKDNMGGVSANRLTSPVDGDVLGGAGGAESHTLTEGQMPDHGHPYMLRTTQQVSPDANISGGFIMNSGGTQAVQTAFNGTPTATAGQQIGGTGNNEAHPNVQPTLILNKIIYAGVA